MVFEDGDMAAQTFVIPVIDDADSEVAEQFTVVLSNPPSGSALIDINAVSYLVLVLKLHNLINGQYLALILIKCSYY